MFVDFFASRPAAELKSRIHQRQAHTRTGLSRVVGSFGGQFEHDRRQGSRQVCAIVESIGNSRKKSQGVESGHDFD